MKKERSTTKKYLHVRILSLILAAAMIASFAVPVSASPGGISWKKSNRQVPVDLTGRQTVGDLEEVSYKPTDSVRASIILEEKSTIQAGFSTMDIACNTEAMAYDAKLRSRQETLAATIATQALGGETLDVVWSLTLVGNIISANVPYGKLEDIQAVDGVKSVVMEQQYEPHVVSKEETAEPQMYTSGGMIGSQTVWSNGYTGAGSRIAVIDTGTDTDHQSFDSGAFMYAMKQNCAEKNMGYEAYLESLNLLDKDEIADVLQQLNVYERNGTLTAEDLYLNEKLAFGYNYVDMSRDITHDNDVQGEHGSHVAGISAANRYIPQGDSYVDALEHVFVAGVAPDAQLVTMKVFGRSGGAHDSDYMAAIEDAILLGCDSVNLSLGSGSPGVSYNDVYADLLEYLTTTETVVVTSAGNSGHWAMNAGSDGYLYNDYVNFATGGSPASYTNSLGVASVDNSGAVGYYLAVNGKKIVYTEDTSFGNDAMATLDTSADGSGTEYEYIFVDGFGVESDYKDIDLTGKVVFCSRGTSSFFEKANVAASRGAVATVIYNNQPGTIGLNLTGYTYSAPCVSVLQSEGAAVKAQSVQQTTEGGLTYYLGKLMISGQIGAAVHDPAYYTMSSFSSWGVPGNLSMKPEITAPGGSIYSVYGSTPAGGGSDQYELMSGTSMAAPQVSGMVALIAQYLNETGENADMSVRHLATSLLMSTAEPLREEASGGSYYSILSQGSGLARVDLATSAESYVLVEGQNDGKVKVELGDDPDRVGEYTFSFSVHNRNGREMDYVLNADVFTQDVFEGADGYFRLDTRTRPLPASVQFSSDGDTILRSDTELNCDLNGDGATDVLDADYLLEFLLSHETELKADGDVNGDGSVDTYDAHLLLAMLGSKTCLTVPANGFVTVDVTICLGDDVKTYLDTYYPNGAYIEAFVIAEPVADAEGVQGVTHSIPVLGFYGGWTESSMFDVGSYVENAYGLEKRTSYLARYAQTIGETMAVNGDYLTVDYGDGEEYFYGGNPITSEAEYRQDRNALNNQNGAAIKKFGNTLIRNAAASRLVISNANTGEIYYEQEMGEQEGAYYHVSTGDWMNYAFRLKLNWKGTDAQGKPLPEGTSVDIVYAAAPEYYRIDNGDGTYSINWKALGQGAYETTRITIDNTAPELKQIELDIMAGNVLRVTAQDNQYVAAVALLNAKGNSILSAAPANQSQAHTEVTTDLDLSRISGSKFLVAVYDYAKNVTVYEAELNLKNQRPYFTVLETPITGGPYTWLGFDADDTDPVTMGKLQTKNRPLAVEYVEGYVFTVTGVFDDFKLQVSSDDDLEVFFESELDPTGALMLMDAPDLAYNAADGKLYALVSQIGNFWGNPYLAVIDMYLGTVECVGEIGVKLSSLACDGKGNFYGMHASQPELYTFTLDSYNTPAFVGNTDSYANTYLSFGNMTWDDNTGKLYWISYKDNAHHLLEVDPATAAVTHVRNVPEYTAGLYIRPEKDGGLFAPTDEVYSVEMNASSVNVMKNNAVQLEAVVKPWTVSDNAVKWTSADTSIAVVDENGLVTGMGVGTTTITATSVLNSTKSATCTVTVTSLNKTLNGLVWDEEGQVWWSQFNTDTLPVYTKLTQDPTGLAFASATQLPDGTIYAATLDNSSLLSDLYKVDPATLEATKIGSSSTGYFDLAWAPNLTENGMLLSVYGPYVVVVDPATGAYVGAFQWSEDANLVGIAYCETKMNYVYYEYVDYFYLIDADGNIYREGFMDIDGVYYYYDGPERGFVSNVGYEVDSPYFHSAYYLPAGICIGAPSVRQITMLLFWPIIRATANSMRRVSSLMVYGPWAV